MAGVEGERPKGPSKQSLWHHAQRKRVIEAHPEVRKLFKPEPLQLIPVLGLMTARWGMAYALRDSPLWLIGVCACTVGTWSVHGLGTYGHEQAHRLIASGQPWAMIVDVILEIGLTSFGRIVGYQYRHVNFHHVYLGDYEWDPEMRDLCAHVTVVSAEQRSWLVTRALVIIEGCLSMLTPAGGLYSQDVMEWLRSRFLIPDVKGEDSVRPPRFQLPAHLARKKYAFLTLSVVCYVVCAWAWGWRAMVFALWSLAVKVSRFDIIAWGQDIAEHNSDNDDHPTNSTKSIFNWIFANTGYHTEHHSFGNVPGCYLPRLTAAAPEEFKFQPDSWATLWLRWARSNFKSFRLTEQQIKIAEAGRCSRKPVSRRD